MKYNSILYEGTTRAKYSTIYYAYKRQEERAYDLQKSAFRVAYEDEDVGVKAMRVDPRVELNIDVDARRVDQHHLVAKQWTATARDEHAHQRVGAQTRGLFAFFALARQLDRVRKVSHILKVKWKGRQRVRRVRAQEACDQ